VGNGVGVKVGVKVGVGVADGVRVTVALGVRVGDGVRVRVALLVGVGVLRETTVGSIEGTFSGNEGSEGIEGFGPSCGTIKRRSSTATNQ
jgi:hypothetical protein